MASPLGPGSIFTRVKFAFYPGDIRRLFKMKQATRLLPEAAARPSVARPSVARPPPRVAPSQFPAFACHTASVSGEPCARMPLSVRISSVAAMMAGRENTRASPPF